MGDFLEAEGTWFSCIRNVRADVDPVHEPGTSEMLHAGLGVTSMNAWSGKPLTYARTTESAWLHYLPWNDGGYADVFVLTADETHEQFVTRLNLYQDGQARYNYNLQHSGSTCTCVVAG